MIAKLECETLCGNGLHELRAALESDGLPASDLSSSQAEFFRFHEQGSTLGFAGLEGQGTDLLLRSMWICPARRDQGAGQRVLQWIEEHALIRGCVTLHLLTTTAERFFLREGFALCARALAPPGICASQEFQMLCPASAAYLIKTVRSAA